MSEDRHEAQGLSNEEFATLMQGIDRAAPLLRALGRSEKASSVAATPDRCAQREALLLALKPYLSKERSDAAEYLLRLWRVGDALKAMK